jgi:circadian clock protein KaiC
MAPGVSQRELDAPDLARSMPELPKALTGIAGLDEVTRGGLPRGRATLVCGPAGCGKTLLAMEFLVRGITQYGEPGVFVAFEESGDDLRANVGSLGFDLSALEADGTLVVDHVDTLVQMDETGEWDLEGLFIRLGSAIDQVGAKRVVLDTFENLFGGFHDTGALRTELRRLLGWLKQRGVTAVLTAERGEGTLTRYGIEEYVSDCVIVLDHRVIEQTSTRRLRVLKYRGSLHGTNEYPFFIGARGMLVLPITSLGLHHSVSEERISTGLPRLDGMLGGSGVYRGSSVLVSGAAGTGKSTLMATFCSAACERGERTLYVAFEESQAQIIRNMRSAGIDLGRWVDAGLLRFHCVRPSVQGMEAHLAGIQGLVAEHRPGLVALDPISSLVGAALGNEGTATLTREIDYLKGQGITAIFAGLITGRDADDVPDAQHQIASLIDTWLLVKTIEGNGERNRALYILKSRGMAHSNQIREFLITEHGIELTDVYVGSERVLTGSARAAQEAGERLRVSAKTHDLEQRQTNLERRRKSVEAQAAIMWRDFQAEADLVAQLVDEGSTAGEDRAEQRVEQGRLRSADVDGDEAFDPRHREIA